MARGFTLIELVVALTILSILAAAAVPYAELSITRSKELELRRSLREIRTAIDRLHDDWENGRLSKLGNGISDDGYPRTLDVLLEGVETGEAKGGKRKYLRRIPEDPFGESRKPAKEHWALRGYQDDSEALSWSGRDVYDVRSQSDRMAIDGTRYREW